MPTGSGSPAAQQFGMPVDEELRAALLTGVLRVPERHAGQRDGLVEQRRGVRERSLTHPRHHALAIGLDVEAKAGVLHAART